MLFVKQHLKTTLVSVFNLICKISVLYRLNTGEELSSSFIRWKMAVDHKRKLYFLEYILFADIFWVNLK